jgi:formamidopyrimidine-DNA glycosylase
MPELPDVEIFRGYFNATSLHQKTTGIEVRNAKVLKEISARKLRSALVGHSFQSTRRHGKYLFAETDGTNWLVLHFGMTGYLKYFKNLDEDEKHTRVLFSFANGFHLAYVCQRLLGEVNVIESPDDFIKERSMGADAFDVSYDRFKQIISGSTAAIKSTLMNQEILAGIGNIYGDEILFQSKIHPKTKSNTLRDKTIQCMYRNMHKVWRTAVDKQADPDRFPRTYLLPNRAEGAKCPRCKQKIQTLKVIGRTAYFCPKCQNKNS